MSEEKSANKILIVDDVSLNRAVLSDILCDEFETVEASDGAKALLELRNNPDNYGLVLLDIVMPNVNGFEVLKEMNKTKLIDRLPVIVISGDNSQDIETESLSLKASDFIRKPFDAAVVLKRVKNIYSLYTYRRSLEKKVAEQTKIIRQYNDNLLDLLGVIVEYRDSESGNHVHRVKAYTEAIANSVRMNYKEYGLTPKQVKRIASASVLHDLGKIAIPDSILLKPGKLTSEEFEIMKSHTVKGGEILLHAKGAWDKEFNQICYEICRHHHERYDGRGYPDHLKGEEIPIEAQIVSLADVFDALVTDRVYKKAYTPEEAKRMIFNGECGTFSPKILNCFEEVFPRFLKIVEAQKNGESIY